MRSTFEIPRNPNEVSIEAFNECETCGCLTKNKTDKRTGKTFCSHSCKSLDKENEEKND